MTRPPSWLGSPPGPSHGLLQPGEGGHRALCDPECVQGDRAGNRQERRDKKQCLRGDTRLFFSASLQDASSSPFSPGKASPRWLWPQLGNVPPREAPFPWSPSALLLVGAVGWETLVKAVPIHPVGLSGLDPSLWRGGGGGFGISLVLSGLGSLAAPSQAVQGSVPAPCPSLHLGPHWS